MVASGGTFQRNIGRSFSSNTYHTFPFSPSHQDNMNGRTFNVEVHQKNYFPSTFPLGSVWESSKALRAFSTFRPFFLPQVVFSTHLPILTAGGGGGKENPVLQSSAFDTTSSSPNTTYRATTNAYALSEEGERMARSFTRGRLQSFVQYSSMSEATHPREKTVAVF